ncbi:MAG: TIGR04211 family SH3 domain-containing protein [Shewanella sp.]|nr:TIGR04211 family SH3 domain-containing protein [Shewanella sp.]MCF1429535.1 TIGR04211 family SH3 domain-containing protein [Shewanella sp.]MCF1437611.1 TIGR04211 family SH3 domain-containing protein [Shewanella sp.]MCF1457719.1 TIGR04211 family SH3 domain-containing protein [Shewanella sp.]
MLRLLALVTILLASPNLLAASQNRYISEDIYVFIHGGPGTQYRIIGSVEAGRTVTLLGETQGDYSKVLDHKGREGWVKTDQLQSRPSFRVVVPELKDKLADVEQQLKETRSSDEAQSLNLAHSVDKISRLESQLAQMTQERDQANTKLNSLLEDQDYEMWRQGGMIAGAGILLGLLIAYLPRPQRRNRNRWMN